MNLRSPPVLARSQGRFNTGKVHGRFRSRCRNEMESLFCLLDRPCCMSRIAQPSPKTCHVAESFHGFHVGEKVAWAGSPNPLQCLSSAP